jgi:hypothetical protein
MQSSWIDSYYEAVEFFYWEPQRLRPKSDAAAELAMLAKTAKKSSKLDGVLNRLRQMEVTLNHNIKQFLLLAPDSLRNDLFGKMFNRPFKGTFVMQGRDVDTEFKLDNCTQPDFLFISELDVVSIEMKVNAKCSVDQVLKYALLGLAVEMQQGPKKHYLTLLGSGDFVKQFRGKRFDSPDKLTTDIKKEELNLFLRNKPRRFRERQECLQEIVNKMQVQFLNYAEFVAFLENAAPLLVDQSPGAEVYRKLIAGLCKEIKDRHLA